MTTNAGEKSSMNFEGLFKTMNERIKNEQEKAYKTQKTYFHEVKGKPTGGGFYRRRCDNGIGSSCKWEFRDKNGKKHVFEEMKDNGDGTITAQNRGILGQRKDVYVGKLEDMIEFGGAAIPNAPKSQASSPNQPDPLSQISSLLGKPLT